MNFEANPQKQSICGFLHKCTQSAKQDFHFCQTLLTLCLEFPTVLKLKVVDFPTARTPVSLYNVSFNKKAKREVIELTRLQNKKKSTLWILLCKKKPKKTHLCTFTAPKWLDSQKSTETRQGTLTEYFQSLLNMPSKISHCQLVRAFFKVRPDDESPPAPNV